ncbi:MAG: 30S ribosomal protein S16 [Spirochaetota bacterium]
MSVRIRLRRAGTRKKPYYRIVAVDSRKKRDGVYLENLGVYHPLEREDKEIILNEQKLKEWLLKGAQPSHTVKILLNKKGIRLK